MAHMRRSYAPPSLEAANQAQIDDLVRRNHTLEYANNKLSEQLSTEVERSKEAVLEIKKQWQEQEKAWREQCEELLACYRIAQLRTALEVETEKTNVLNEQKDLRREKVLRLQRDFRITMFHAKERELEERIHDLEEENERMLIERKELGLALKQKLAELIAQLRLKDGEIADLQSEQGVTEKDVSKLREENAHLQASLASTSSKLERINLQLEGSQTSRQELEGLNDELKRKNHDLQRQLDKWQRLENKGEAELDTVRKRKIELEVEVKELESRLDKAADENTKALEKEARRLEHLKTTALEWKEVAEASQAELSDAQKELTALRKQLEQVQAEQPKAPPSQPSKRANATRSKKPSPTTDSETEPEVVEKSKPSKRRKKGTASESEIDDVPEVQGPVKTTQRRKKMSPLVEESEVEEVDESPPKAKGGKGKAKATKQATENKSTKPKAKAKAVEISDVEEKEPAPKRKRKAPADDPETEAEKPAKKITKAGRKAGTSRIGTADSPPKQPVSGPARDTPHTPDDRESTGVDPVQKKKRKINIFAAAGSQSTQQGGFDFGLGGLNGGLNIPTTLSPLKESEGPIPNRAMSSALSTVGGLIRSRMVGGR